jgi:hypothetical protein
MNTGKSENEKIELLKDNYFHSDNYDVRSGYFIYFDSYIENLDIDDENYHKLEKIISIITDPKIFEKFLISFYKKAEVYADDKMIKLRPISIFAVDVTHEIMDELMEKYYVEICGTIANPTYIIPADTAKNMLEGALGIVYSHIKTAAILQSALLDVASLLN